MLLRLVSEVVTRNHLLGRLTVVAPSFAAVSQLPAVVVKSPEALASSLLSYHPFCTFVGGMAHG